MELEWDIPSTWEVVPLKDLASEGSSQILPADHPDTLFNYWGLDAIQKGQFEEPAPNYVPGRMIRSTCIQFDNTHILYAKLRPYLNKVIVPSMAGIGSTEWIVLKPNCRLVDRKYLAYVLRTRKFVEYASANTTGSRMPRLKKDALWKAKIPIPYPNDPDRSLAEQRRIVARLEALLGEVREMRAEIRAMREDVERLMEAVLAEVFPEYPGELPDGWRWVPISTIVQSTETRNPRHRANSSYQPQLPLFNSTGDTKEKKTFQYVEISSIDNKNYRIMLDKVRCIPNQDAPSRARKVIRKNDIIFATTRPYLKNIAIVPDELDDEICSTGFCVLRPIGDKAEPKFVFYAVRANSFIKQLLPKQRGANYPAVTDSDVLGSYIPIPCSAGGKPSKEEQRRVATYLEFVEREIQAIRAILDEDERAVEELEQSILAAAFRGEV